MFDSGWMPLHFWRETEGYLWLEGEGSPGGAGESADLGMLSMRCQYNSHVSSDGQRQMLDP